MSVPRAVVPVLLVLGAALGLTALIRGGGHGTEHPMSVVVSEAASIVTGQQVRIAGQPAGRVTGVEVIGHGTQARIRFDVDQKAWPLHAGTSFQLRWNGTVSFNNRYLALTPGPASGAVLRDGAVLPTGRHSVPVEFDELVNAFTPPVRADTKRFLDHAGPAFSNARRPLEDALSRTPPALDEATSVLQDLAADDDSLKALVRETGSVASAVQAADPGLQGLVDGAGATFTAVADRSAALQQTLALAPGTLDATRTTLHQADPTLSAAGKLASRLAPGIGQLRQLAHPLNGALITLAHVGPSATHTLATLRGAAPQLKSLLDDVGSLSPSVRSAAGQASNELKCIRPYAPDLGGFASNWGSFLDSADDRDKVLRATYQNIPQLETNAQSEDSSAVVQQGLRYAFPRPPGDSAGQPWFLPECGITKDAYDPAKDPESPYENPNGKRP